MRVLCPWCEEDIREDVSTCDEWEEGYFSTNCPKCGKALDVECTVAEYEYEVTKQKDVEG